MLDLDYGNSETSRGLEPQSDFHRRYQLRSKFLLTICGAGRNRTFDTFL